MSICTNVVDDAQGNVINLRGKSFVCPQPYCLSKLSRKLTHRKCSPPDAKLAAFREGKRHATQQGNLCDGVR